LCQAVDPLRTGHDRAQIAARARAIQDQVMREGRKELKRIAREAATETIGTEILSFRESQRANVCTFPRPGKEYTTDAMAEAARAVEDIRRTQLGPVPIDITADQVKAAADLIDMAEAKNGGRPLPATDQEKYEQLCEDLACGVDLGDAQLAWMKRHELWLETGERAAF
jgi:putative transposase